MRAEATVRLGQRAGADIRDQPSGCPMPRVGRVAALYCSAERIVLIRGRHFNLNLRELHDSMFGEPQGGSVRFVIVNGARILSRSAALPALRTGPWPAMPLTLTIENNGRIQGKAGASGHGGNGSNLDDRHGGAGTDGGDALLIERATTIINASGQIWSGGGGNGGGGGRLDPIIPRGWGGGGGAGSAGSNAGDATSGGLGQNGGSNGTGGTNGSATSQGTAGTATDGAGNGGGLGAPGEDGQDGVTATGAGFKGNGGAKGLKGRYVVGNALVTWTSVGDVRGSVA